MTPQKNRIHSRLKIHHNRQRINPSPWVAHNFSKMNDNYRNRNLPLGIHRSADLGNGVSDIDKQDWNSTKNGDSKEDRQPPRHPFIRLQPKPPQPRVSIRELYEQRRNPNSPPGLAPEPWSFYPSGPVSVRSTIGGWATGHRHISVVMEEEGLIQNDEIMSDISLAAYGARLEGQPGAP